MNVRNYRSCDLQPPPCQKTEKKKWKKDQKWLVEEGNRLMRKRRVKKTGEKFSLEIP